MDLPYLGITKDPRGCPGMSRDVQGCPEFPSSCLKVTEAFEPGHVAVGLLGIYNA